MRRVPPTILPTSLFALWRAGLAPSNVHDLVVDRSKAEQALTQTFARPVAALVDSGTSALTLALQYAKAGPRATRDRRVSPLLVAVPAYGCIDVPTAVLGVGAQAMAYDIDPSTLGPDRDSLLEVLNRGADVVIISHLFGHPVALDEWRKECDRRDVVLIEDAAQWAGARWATGPLGAHGHFVVLSLGRGKGLVGTGGGVLLGGESFRGAAPIELSPRGRAGALLQGTAAALLGRPVLYGLPASVPALRLGEMVFHEPQPPQALSLLSARLLPAALSRADSERAKRATVAQHYLAAALGRGVATAPIVTDGATPGVLRQPFVLQSQRPIPTHLGVVFPYPRPLCSQVEVAAIVRAGPSAPGADTLASRLICLPVHRRVSRRDIASLCDWLSGSS
jgi:dTDP-4-amino-4,6-dideoxygalactose transaminase